MSRSDAVSLTRRVGFSAGHRYWFDSLSEAENRKLFGAIASPYSHGHNYILDVAIEGTVDPETGMVVNIKRIDDVLQEHVVSWLDSKSLNDEIELFKSRSPCLENLLQYIESAIRPHLSGQRITHLRLEEMPTLWGELDLKIEPKLTLTRTYEFAAAHRLHAPLLSEEQNFELYGKCTNTHGHGHNYIVEVTVSGKQDPQTGMIVDLASLDRVVHKEVVDRYDHKNLNLDLPEFAGQITTSEVVVQAIWDRLEPCVPGQLEKVRLFETARNIFEVVRA